MKGGRKVRIAFAMSFLLIHGLIDLLVVEIHNLAKKYRQKTAKYTDERVSTTKKPVSPAAEQKPLSSGVIQNSLKRSREGAELLYLDISEPDAKHQRLGTF